jgi:hypothetical protein
MVGWGVLLNGRPILRFGGKVVKSKQLGRVNRIKFPPRSTSRILSQILNRRFECRLTFDPQKYLDSFKIAL